MCLVLPFGASARRGHDVLWAFETMAREDDPTILEQAQARGRILVTNDKDFGKLVVDEDLPAFSGVILLRLGGLDPQEIMNRTISAIQSRDDWAGHFSVIDRRRIRMQPLKTKQ